MIWNVIFVILFVVLFNWAVNLQIVAQLDNNNRSKTIAVIMNIAVTILLGIIICV